MPLEIAVLGLGSIGLRHARNFMALGCSVTGFDPDRARQSLLEDAGGTVAASREMAIEGSQAVVVASPNRFHKDDLAACVKAGRSALVEKPLAHTDRGLADILDAADARRLTIAVAHNMRFHPAIEAAAETINAGRLGKLLWAHFIFSAFLPDWRPHQDYRVGYTADAETGGVIFDSIHEFDMAAYLLGPLSVVQALARRTGVLEMNSEDCADIWLQHPGGALISIHLDYVTKPRVRRSLIVGDKGRIEIDVDGRGFTFSSADGKERLSQIFETSIDDDYRQEASDFLRNLNEKTPPRCSGREGSALLGEVLKARRLAKLPEAAG